MSTRIYVPGSWTGTRELFPIERFNRVTDPERLWNVRRGRGYAVTDALRRALPDLDDEQLEHYAMTEAAQASILKLEEEDVPLRRLVLAVDVDQFEPVSGSLCEVAAEYSLPYDVVAWLVDTDAATKLVERAVDFLPLYARTPEELRQFEEAAERCLDHELAWYAANEVDEVMKLR